MNKRPRKLFIDVGGHFGETIEAVIDPIFAIDEIYSFEPSNVCYKKILDKFQGVKHLHVFNAGLADRAEIRSLFKPGSEGASFFSDHTALDPGNMRDDSYQEVESCAVLDASAWFFSNISHEDYVIMKLNCEGAEISILQSLIRTGEILKINNLLVDFDARKIPSISGMISETEASLRESGVPYYLPEAVQYGGGSHYGGIQQWLRKTGESDRSVLNVLRSLKYHTRNFLDGHNRNWYKLLVIRALPSSIAPRIQAFWRSYSGPSKNGGSKD